jgi:hypothetical protein
MLRRIIPIVGMVFLFGCIQELEVDTNSGINTLVVEGFVDTEPGPHDIVLSRTAKFGNVFEGFAGPVEGASVVIRDNEGRSIFLNESSPGVYQTPQEFEAVVGSTYTLLINTAEGQQYSSLPELVRPVTPYDTIYPVFTSLPALPGELPVTGVDVVVEWQDNGESRDFYQWRNSGLYQFMARPDLFVDIFNNPAPKDCCEICWLEELPDQGLRVRDDRNINGNRSTEVVAFIEDDGLRFFDKYLIRVEQFSMTQEAFQFFELLDEQLSISGDIFDPPPAKITGNMINIDDPDEDVIGYFWAADVHRDSAFIFPTVLEVRQQMTIIPDDCREVDGATTEEPFPW